jgi:outer membrane protein OmpA-like peptidoglycan-associated protein
MSRFHGTRQRRAFDVWQIVYIDLMTNVMIFFVVLWAVSARPNNKGGISDTLGTETVKMVNLPGDVLFTTGKSDLSEQGRQVLGKLFADSHAVLNFDTGGLTKRLLVIHGHTDNDGAKDKNLDLGYQRALAAYRETLKYGGELADHVVICTHADNSPAQDVPAFAGNLTPAEQTVVSEAKAKNRRIVIEDKLVSRTPESAP